MKYLVITLLSFAIIYISSEWWRVGGDRFTIYRNPGVPICIGLTKFIMYCVICDWPERWMHVFLFSLIYIPLLWGAIRAFSYGLNSPIHKFWVFITGKGSDGNYRPVEIVTRATCGFCWAMPAIVYAIVSYTWILFAVYTIFLTIANGIIGGTVKDVEISERGVGACVGLSVLI